MYKKNFRSKTSIVQNTATVEESIEHKMRRILNNKEPITDGAPLVYTERSKGVVPEYNIRTDRFEIAAEAMDKAAKNNVLKREENHKKTLGEKAKEGMDKENTQNNTGGESVEGTK